MARFRVSRLKEYYAEVEAPNRDLAIREAQDLSGKEWTLVSDCVDSIAGVDGAWGPVSEDQPVFRSRGAM